MRRIRESWLHYFEDDQTWGSRRFLSVLAALICLAIVGRAIEPIDTAPASLVALALSFLRLNALRHWIPPLAAMAFALTAGTFYLQDIFEFKSFRGAFRYLFAAMFGWSYPSLTIRNGRMDIPPDEENTLAKIGGPGHLSIALGNVVLLERGSGPTGVLGAGRYFMRRFETIREVVNLREVYRQTKETEAITKDGIAVTVRNIEATFHVDIGRQQRRSEANPYPFSVQAVRAAVYDRAVRDNGQQAEWADAVMGAIIRQVGTWIAGQRLDKLTAPTEDDPRTAIRSRLTSAEVRRQLRGMGAELVWVNIGHLDAPDAVDQQRAETWQAFWQTQQSITRAEGDAVRMAYKDIGRAEGQAEMLSAIARALQNAPAIGGDGDGIGDLVLAHIGRVIEAMTTQPGLSELEANRRLGIRGTAEPPSMPALPEPPPPSQ